MPRSTDVRVRLAAGLLAAGPLALAIPVQAQETMIQSITPILYVQEIEPVLPFWTERLGFQVSAEVGEGERLGFVILERDGTELMIQTRESVENDVPALADTPMGGTILFIRVADLDAVIEKLQGAEVLVPRRTTFYGAEEIYVREPGGNVVGFAEFGEEGG